jgi:hypothetical protein
MHWEDTSYGDAAVPAGKPKGDAHRHYVGLMSFVGRLTE